MRFSALFVLAALAPGAAAAADQDQGALLRGRADDKLSLSQREREDNRAVTKVVRLLETMLKTSKAEGDTERELYAKHKCYCDDTEETKTTRIDKLDTTIKTLAAEIAGLSADVATASAKAADLLKRMEENEEKRKELKDIRDNEKAAFESRDAELTEMKGMLNEAISILTEIGADQVFSAQGHTQQMAKFDKVTLAQVQRTLKQAAMAAAAMGKTSHAEKLSGFLQATAKGKGPFTATYSTQSGEIFGILADMRDNCIKEASEIAAKEEAAQKAYDELKKVLEEEHEDMSTEATGVQTSLAGWDEQLSSKKKQKKAAEEDKAEEEDFVATLQGMCAEKAEQYEKRVALRTQEETAVSQAIAILNNDMAFEAFGKVAATSTGMFLQGHHDASTPGSTGTKYSFLQLRGRKGHLIVTSDTQRKRADAMLRKVSAHSTKAAKIAAMLEAENPFTEVLEAIDQMIEIIEEEGETDVAKDEWCKKERSNKTEYKTKATDNILKLETGIAELETSIENLKRDIAGYEDTLKTTVESQTSETAARKADNLAYQKNIENLVEASDLLKKAIVVLKGYYEDVLSAAGTSTESLVEISEDPKFKEEEWSGYKGQSDKGGDAVQMLEYILDTTKKEETSAHAAEEEDQTAYETSMTTLKETEELMLKNIEVDSGTLSDCEEDLLGKKKDLKANKDVVAKIEAYLEKIAPGCDFILNNIALRGRSREDEKTALEGAKEALMATPVYKEAVAAAHNETLGDCVDICAVDEDHVDCLACKSKVSVPGYCAGHAGAKGC